MITSRMGGIVTDAYLEHAHEFIDQSRDPFERMDLAQDLARELREALFRDLLRYATMIEAR